MTREQLEAIYAALPGSARPHLVLIGGTGVRVGEAQNLRWHDVEIDGPSPRITVLDGTTRNARRAVPLTRRGYEVLAGLREAERVRCGGGPLPEQHVLPDTTQKWLRQALTAACASAGTERLKVHGFRHVYAFHLVQRGVPPSTIARLVGHADGGVLVTRLYGRWMPHDAEARAAAAPDWWRSAGTANH